MFPKLKISSFLLKRLEKIKQQCSGCLFGVFYGDHTLLLLGFNIESTIGQLNYKQIQHKFPADVDLCGLIKFGDCTDSEAHLNEIFQDIDITDNPILLQCKLGTLVDLKTSIFMHGKLENLSYDVMDEQELYRDFYFSRLRCNFNLYTEETPEQIKSNMQILRKNLAYGNLAFHVKNTKIYLTGGENEIIQTNQEQQEKTIYDIIKIIKQSTKNDNNGIVQKSTIQQNKKNTNKSNQNLIEILNQYEIININVLKNKTKIINQDGHIAGPITTTPTAFLMQINRNEKKISIPLEIDAMAILYRNTKISGLYDILIESVCRSLRLIEQTLIKYYSTPKNDDCNEIIIPLSKPIIYHFLPLEFGHFLTVPYMENIPEDNQNLQLIRKKLHHNFGLPLIKPYFRRSNKYPFTDELPPKLPLLNTHIGLRSSGVVDGKQYLVKGHYSYYHYMQQEFNDNGWGCAYRSLQTLCSWFKWQGYTDIDIPTHLDIQKYLVKIGDKSNNFINSKQWIGSTEVGMCLEGFLGVSSKILHCSSGRDLANKGTDLAMHFESQGTPIMIGGGVLAHTIIGVDFNNQTGDIKFLILDPHFTEADDLNIIQGKGWCGWKGTDFWDKKSYYNLCMPQRPILY